MGGSQSRFSDGLSRLAAGEELDPPNVRQPPDFDGHRGASAFVEKSSTAMDLRFEKTFVYPDNRVFEVFKA